MYNGSLLDIAKLQAQFKRSEDSRMSTEKVLEKLRSDNSKFIYFLLIVYIKEKTNNTYSIYKGDFQPNEQTKKSYKISIFWRLEASTGLPETDNSGNYAWICRKNTRNLIKTSDGMVQILCMQWRVDSQHHRFMVKVPELKINIKNL